MHKQEQLLGKHQDFQIRRHRVDVEKAKKRVVEVSINLSRLRWRGFIAGTDGMSDEGRRLRETGSRGMVGLGGHRLF
jgi:hypothetical protein